MILDADVPIPDRIVAGIERARHHIATAGAWWTGAQRVALAGAARRAASGAEPEATDAVPAVAQRTAAKIATDAHDIGPADVDAFDDPAAYVEIVGVVARTLAIDTAARGIGASPVPLPAGTDDRPRGRVDPRARRRSALVPTVGAAGATTALSAVPAEDAAQADLHGALYLGYAEMGDLTIRKGLPRWQLELIAARTSLINQCFF